MSNTRRETTTVREACKRLGIGATTGFEAIRRGEFPVRIIRIGKRILVVTADLDRLLASQEDMA